MLSATTGLLLIVLAGARSISGGEKRRVSIDCELVTGPSILFLDAVSRAIAYSTGTS